MAKRNYFPINNIKQPLIQVHLADLHFGAMDPQKEYNILVEQVLLPIANMPFNILAIDGDLFDRKYMANSDPIIWASRFIGDCVNLCISKNATMIAISGTESHDSGQWAIFDYLENSENVDFRIVKSTKFESVFGYKILCIPEEYGKGEDYYYKFLDQEYDTVFMHGTLVGGIITAKKENLNANREPVFDINSFNGCRGPIIAGHVHSAMCLKGYMYYVSNPIRYKFGEEAEKGYCIVLQNPNGAHYFEFMPIESFRYDTIRASQIAFSNPKELSAYIDNLQSQGVDHVKLKFDISDDVTFQIIREYYANNPSVVIENTMKQKISDADTTDEIIKKYEGLDFLMDPSLDEINKFIKFINYNEGKDIITIDRLKSILNS